MWPGGRVLSAGIVWFLHMHSRNRMMARLEVTLRTRNIHVVYFHPWRCTTYRERLFTFLQQMTNILPSHMERFSSMDFRWVYGLQILQVQNFRLVTKLYGSFDISTLIWLAHLAALFYLFEFGVFDFQIKGTLILFQRGYASMSLNHRNR